MPKIHWRYQASFIFFAKIYKLAHFVLFQTKCEKYWVDLGHDVRFGKITLHTTEENVLGGIVQRKFTIKHDNEVSCEQQLKMQTFVLVELGKLNISLR